MDKVVMINRGDIVRAVRQCIADEGIDIRSLVKETVDGAAAKRLQNIDMAPILRQHVVESIKEHLYEIMESIARHMARRLTLSAPE